MHLSNCRFPVSLVILLAFSASEAQRPDGATSADTGSRALLPAFGRVVYLEDDAATSANVSVGGLNGDGNLDIVLAKGRHWPLVFEVGGGQGRIYINEGGAEPSFRAVPFGPPDAAIRVSQAADLDGHCWLDIVAIHEDRSRLGIRLYFGEGSERFSEGVPVDNGGRYPYALAVADLDLDGHTDIVVGNIRAPSSVYFNHGSGRGFNRVTFGDDEGDAYGFGIGDLDNGPPPCLLD